jgi:hypothetical protein
MKTLTKKLLKIAGAIILLVVFTGLGGYLYLVYQLKSSLSGCTVQTGQFMETMDFEFVNNWIVVKVKLDGSEKEYPFIFDTGSLTIVSDSLLNDLSSGDYKVFSSSNSGETSNAFSNRLYILNGLSLGNVRFSEIGSMKLNNERWEMLNCISAYGIIGYNILESCCFQIDYSNRKITITNSAEQLSNYSNINWIKYRTDKQETPIIKAKLNGDLDAELFFDTGNNGGITLYSPDLYSQFAGSSSGNVVSITQLPTLYIRGESPTAYKALRYKATTLELLDGQSEDGKVITICNLPERNFTGIVGNSFLRDYIITLDYRQKKIGYIADETTPIGQIGTFGFNYFARNRRLFIGSIYDDSEIARKGIVVGDEISAINGINIAELPDDAFCSIYRKEFSFTHDTDSLLHLEVKHDSGIVQLELHKYSLF